MSYIVPKGKRRQATLDEMKTNYVHELERFSYEKIEWVWRNEIY